MAIYITGDTHGGIDVRKLESKRFKEGKQLTKDDYLIVTGDFGVWKNKKSQDFLKWLDEKKWTTLFVEGNHEDYMYLDTFPLVNMFGNKVRKINDSVYQLLRGEIYNIDGYKIFAFGGARSVDRFSACRQEGVDWFPQEECSYKEELMALYNLEKEDNKVDIIISHTCSKSTLDYLADLYNIYIEDYDNQNKFFEKIKNIVNYNVWVFGHIHKDLRINDKERVIYNDVINIDTLYEEEGPLRLEKFKFNAN